MQIHGSDQEWKVWHYFSKPSRPVCKLGTHVSSSPGSWLSALWQKDASFKLLNYTGSPSLTLSTGSGWKHLCGRFFSPVAISSAVHSMSPFGGSRPFRVGLGTSERNLESWDCGWFSSRGIFFLSCILLSCHRLTNIFLIALRGRGRGSNERAVFIRHAVMYGCHVLEPISLSFTSTWNLAIQVVWGRRLVFQSPLYFHCAISASCSCWMKSPSAEAGGATWCWYYISREPLCGLRPKPGRAPGEKGLFLASISFPLGANAGELLYLFLFSLSFLLWRVVQCLSIEAPNMHSPSPWVLPNT